MRTELPNRIHAEGINHIPVVRVFRGSIELFRLRFILALQKF